MGNKPLPPEGGRQGAVMVCDKLTIALKEPVVSSELAADLMVDGAVFLVMSNGRQETVLLPMMVQVSVTHHFTNSAVDR